MELWMERHWRREIIVHEQVHPGKFSDFVIHL